MGSDFCEDPGDLGIAARKWADSIRAESEIPEFVLILVALAENAADLADGARSSGSGRLYLAAAREFTALVDRVERVRGRDGDSGAGAGDGGDVWAEEMARLMGASPEVGDSADS